MNASEGRPSPSPGDDPRVWFRTPRQERQEPYDGRTLASAGEEGTVRLWNTDPAQAVRQICRSHLSGIPYADPWA